MKRANQTRPRQHRVRIGKPVRIDATVVPQRGGKKRQYYFEVIEGTVRQIVAPVNCQRRDRDVCKPDEMTLDDIACRLDALRTRLFVGDGGLESIVVELLDLNRSLVAELKRRGDAPRQSA